MVHTFTKHAFTTTFVQSRTPDYVRKETYTFTQSKA